MTALKLSILVFSALLVPAFSLACAAKSTKSTDFKKIAKRFEKKQRKPSSDLQAFAATHKNPSWEARLGNLLLNHRPAAGTKVVLSIPAHLQKSAYNPFGDGQTNAKMDLGSWKNSAFLVVGIETTSSGTTSRHYKFDSSLNVSKYSETPLPDGWYEVHPEGWNENLYFNFQTRALPLAEFLKGIPETSRKFPINRTAPNLAGISKTNAYAELSSKDLGPGYNKVAWPAGNVHGRFPDETGSPTALGSVLTWGIKTQSGEDGAFKNLYTCFEARNLASENQVNLKEGVPSGAGWHHVGDAAETVINNLNVNPIPFAIARSHGRTNVAHGLSESITAMWVMSDELQVTQQGEFHWYLNPYEESICTEIWVHNCVPNLTNSWGFDCK